jgi:hypothetical protein
MSFISDIARGLSEGVLSPLFSWLNKKEDVDLEKYKVNGQIDVAAVRGHVEALRLRSDLLREAMKHKGIRFFQYAFMFPLVVWFWAIVLFCVAGPYFPEIKVVKALPANLDYILSAIIAFLFAASKIDEWMRRTK